MTAFLRRFILGVLCVALVTGTAEVRAQNGAAVVAPPEALLADAIAKETAVRKVLSSPTPPDTLLKAVRTVVADYEGLVQHYPASTFCDDALWRAAQLSADAFAAFGDAHEQTVAIRLLQTIAAQYPTSKFAKQTQAQLGSLKVSTARSSTRTPAAPPGPAPAAPRPRPVPSTPATGSGKVATIREIRRAVMGDVVRVVIELDKEVPFHDERLDNPARVFVDLPSTRAAAPLKDQTLRFDGDADLVRQVRIGRHPNDTTRVVLEAAGVSSYSIYPLYNPYRLVIDCLRATPEPSLGVLPPFPAPAKPAPPASLLAHRVDALAPALPAVTPIASAALAEAGTVDPQTSSLPASPVPAVNTVPSLPLGSPSRNLAGGFSIARQLGLGVSRIVIDPGHGGHDPGARGGGTTEAELVLDVSLRLEKLLEKIPGVEVVLTRREDEYVSLQERTDIANRESADLFLSIHANASNSSQVQGVETYFLNFATTLSAAAVAARENAASGQNMGALPDVVKTIALNNKLDESKDFATFVQHEMVARLRPANKTLRDLGVKQAPFVVLIGAAMPSVLAEISFMTNPQDARLLKSSPYRQKIAEALFEAIRSYQASLKKGSTLARQSQ
jgi:N-acetylmuramoyl-L-alanine amidase